jgi:hypothetical protein
MKASPAILGLFLFVVSLDFNCYAQGLNDRNKYSAAEISLSNAYFLGSDLPFKSNRSFSPGISFAVMTRQNSRIFNGFKFTMNYPTSRSIGRKDSLSDYGFEYFQTRIQKYEFFLMTDLIKHLGRSQKRPDFIPYLYTGIGWLKVKQFMRYGYDHKETVSSITHQQYTKRSMVLPIGLGVRYKLRNYMDLSLEVIYNYTFINQLDLNYLHGFSHAKGRDSYLNVNLKLGFF